MSESFAIEASGLSKQYDNVAVLKDIALRIPKGRIVGLIGANGAGKTTLLKSILGMTSATGELSVMGLSPKKDRAQLIGKVSFIADTAILPRWIRVDQLLEYMAGVHPLFDRVKAESFLATTKIPAFKKVSQLSKGMITQLHLALIMAIDSQLLILDEPTLGLDLLYRKQFYSTLLNDFYDQDKTVLITTHQVEEVEHILTDVIFMDEGQVILSASVEELGDRFLKIFATEDQKSQLEKQGVNILDEHRRIGGSQLIIGRQGSEGLEGTVPSVAEVFIATVNSHRRGGIHQ